MSAERGPVRCPRSEQLSALIDGELDRAARAEIESHAASCPLCGGMWRELGTLRVALKPLATARVGYDLAPLIDRKLPVSGIPGRPPRHGRWWQGWPLLPVGLAAAGMLAVGGSMGALLATGGATAARQPAVMAMFDLVPPGGVCLGLPSCFAAGR